MRPKRTPKEEEDVLNNIEAVSQGLTKQVSEIQNFLKELKENQHSTETQTLNGDRSGAKRGG